MNSTVTQSERTKRGEIYELPNNQFSIVCVHCLKQFQYFTDFTLHVQNHFQDYQNAMPSSVQACSVELQRMKTNTPNATPELLIDSSDIKVEKKVVDESDDDDDFPDDDFNSYSDRKYQCSKTTTTEMSIKVKRKTSRINAAGRCGFECFICHRKLATAFAVKRHLKIHKYVDLQCKFCSKKFRTSRYYEVHMNKLHPNGTKFVSQLPVTRDPLEKPIIKIFECTLCKKTFRERRQLHNHMVYHKQSPCLCLICGQLFSGDRSLSNHMKLHDSDETHVCTECGRQFKRRRYLLDHNRKAHNLYADNVQPICKICDELFENKRLLHLHMQSHPFEEKRNFPCSKCNFAAKCAYGLRRHLETHSIENRSFECHICHKKFLPRYANDHMKSHDSARNFECQECGKCFKRASTLKRHRTTHGIGGSNFKCDVCSKEFIGRLDHLLRHRRRHGVAMNYHCRICNKGFIEQKSYLIHEASHNNGNVKSEQIETSRI